MWWMTRINYIIANYLLKKMGCHIIGNPRKEGL